MDIQIIPKDVSLTLADQTYIRNRLYFSLAGPNPQVDSAQVSLCAIPGFESESMHHCRVDVQLPNGRSLIGDSSESDIYVAIDRAVGRSCTRLASSDEFRYRSPGHSVSTAFRENHLPSAA
jgi:ribosome-associated translation inhibitor RaiA